MRETFNLTLKNYDGETIDVSLRLSIGALKALERQYCKNRDDMLIETIIMSAFKPTILADVLKEALNFRGNENSIKSGDELYELLVDNGYKGTVDFMGIVADIALTSGVISTEMKDAMINNATKTQEEMTKEIKQKN